MWPVRPFSLGLTLDPRQFIRFLAMPRVTISIKDKQAQPYRFPLDRETVTLGRGSENDITISSGSVSVHHAKMIRVPGGYELYDLDSTNGIKVDGERTASVRLMTGMVVKIGDAEFFFQLSEEEQEELGKETPVEKEVRASVSPREWEDEGEEGGDEEPVRAPNKKKISGGGSSPRQGSAGTLASARGGGGGSLLFFLILAVIAFCAGMAVRYQKETGKSLIDAVLSRGKVEKSPVEAPVEEPPMAE